VLGDLGYAPRDIAALAGSGDGPGS
jgi:hypothetical protein